MREENTASVPPSKGVMSNFGFFSKHLSTDLVRISIICRIVNGIIVYRNIIYIEYDNESKKTDCVTNVLNKPKGSKLTLPGHKEAQVAHVGIHMVLLYSLCKPNKLVL